MNAMEILTLPKEDLYKIMNMGLLNQSVMGYMIDSMRRAGVAENMIKETINTAHRSFDETNAKEAADIYKGYISKPAKRRGR